MTNETFSLVPVSPNDSGVLGKLSKFGVKVKYVVLKTNPNVVAGFAINDNLFILFEATNFTGEQVFQLLTDANVEKNTKKLSQDLTVNWYKRGNDIICFHVSDQASGTDLFGLNLKLIKEEMQND